MTNNELTLEISKKNQSLKKQKKYIEKYEKSRLHATNKKYLFANIKYFLSSSFNRLKVDIEDMVDKKEFQKIFENNCKKTYSEYLELVNSTMGKTGEEDFENELGKGKVVFTEYGPFLRLDIDPKKSLSKKPEILFEGFMPNADGTIYYNYVTLFPVEFNSKFSFGKKTSFNAEGFKIDPQTLKPEPILKYQQEVINPYEFYFKSITNRAINSQNNSAKKYKNNIIQWTGPAKSKEIDFNL